MTAEQHLDLEALNELKEVMGDEFSLLITTFIDDSVTRLDTIKSAVQSADPEAIRRTAHSFKGSASNMGALQLTDHCRRLEELGHSGTSDGADVIFEKLVAEYQQVEQALRQL